MRTPSKVLTMLAAVSAMSSILAAPSYATTGSTAASPQTKLAAAASPQMTQAVAARCRYSIVGTNVRVRSGPGTNYRFVRIKQNGEHVTGPAPCTGTVYANGYYWVKLYLGSGGYGWTAEPYLHYLDYS